MSVWSRIAQLLRSLASGEALSKLLERLSPPPERTVAFTIAVIALGAKMAKADGRVTRDEVAAFREVFHIPPGEERNAARIFNLAREDVAGFEEYALRIRRMFEGRSYGPALLRDLMEGLFHIAMADGRFHPQEEAFLHRVAEIFGLSEREFASLRARHAEGRPDPYAVLGVDPDAPLEEVRAAWRRMVRETHPDRMMARGVPEEAVRLAERRLIQANRAWEEIRRERAA